MITLVKSPHIPDLASLVHPYPDIYRTERSESGKFFRLKTPAYPDSPDIHIVQKKDVSDGLIIASGNRQPVATHEKIRIMTLYP